MSETIGCWIVVYLLTIGSTIFHVPSKIQRGQQTALEIVYRAVKRWGALEPHVKLTAFDVKQVECPPPDATKKKLKLYDEEEDED